MLSSCHSATLNLNSDICRAPSGLTMKKTQLDSAWWVSLVLKCWNAVETIHLAITDFHYCWNSLAKSRPCMLKRLWHFLWVAANQRQIQQVCIYLLVFSRWCTSGCLQLCAVSNDRKKQISLVAEKGWVDIRASLNVCVFSVHLITHTLFSRHCSACLTAVLSLCRCLSPLTGSLLQSLQDFLLSCFLWSRRTF